MYIDPKRTFCIQRVAGFSREVKMLLRPNPSSSNEFLWVWVKNKNNVDLALLDLFSFMLFVLNQLTVGLAIYKTIKKTLYSVCLKFKLYELKLLDDKCCYQKKNLITIIL